MKCHKVDYEIFGDDNKWRILLSLIGISTDLFLLIYKNNMETGSQAN